LISITSQRPIHHGIHTCTQAKHTRPLESKKLVYASKSYQTQYSFTSVPQLNIKMFIGDGLQIDRKTVRPYRSNKLDVDKLVLLNSMFKWCFMTRNYSWLNRFLQIFQHQLPQLQALKTSQYDIKTCRSSENHD